MGRNNRNCRLCGQTMESSPFTMCRLYLVDNNRVRNYIAKHPHVSVDEIAAATNVPL